MNWPAAQLTHVPEPAPPHPPAPAQSGRAGNFANKWTAEGWLASLGLESFVANALLGEGFEGDQLEALRGIGRSDTLQDDLRPPIAAALDLLVPALTQGLKELTTAEAVTLGEMQDKFSQDTKGILEYGSLNSFYGGLEAQVGSPSPKVKEMMAEEHTARGDSKATLFSKNYEVDTTPAIEWRFVAEPDAPPPGGWRLRCAAGRRRVTQRASSSGSPSPLSTACSALPSRSWSAMSTAAGRMDAASAMCVRTGDSPPPASRWFVFHNPHCFASGLRRGSGLRGVRAARSTPTDSARARPSPRVEGSPNTTAPAPGAVRL